MAAGDLHALQAALLLPPEHLGEVRRRAISHTPITTLPGGLLSENEVGQLALRPWPPLKEWECCLKLLKNCGRHRFGCLARPESLLLISKEKRLAAHLGRLLWELQVILRAPWTVLADTSWAWASFLTLSRRSFSISVAISGIETFAVKNSLICRRHRCFSDFAFHSAIISSFSSRPGHGRSSGQFPESS